MASALQLPDHRNLSPHQLGFLDEHFTGDESSRRKPRTLVTQLEKDVVDSNSRLSILRGNLNNLVLSSISHSVTVKSDLQRLIVMVRNLNRYQSRYRNFSATMTEILAEFSELMKEVHQVDTRRKYVETTLRLEGLVGDLEDAVFLIMNQRTRSTFSANFSSQPNSSVSQTKQERFLQAVNTMDDIEKVLFNVKKNRPKWCRLVKSVDSRLDEILAVLRPQIFSDHRALIASLGWPPSLFTARSECGPSSELSNPLENMPQEKREIYSKSFLALCALQHLQGRRENRKLDYVFNHEEINTRLWAISELVSSIALQTEYHFSKWAFDQPDFIFALVYKITRDFIEGVDLILQPLLDKARLLGLSAKEAWVHAMIQMLAQFLGKRVFSVLVERYKDKSMKSDTVSSWLHLIDLIIAFDNQMQSLLTLEPGNVEGHLRGVSTLALVFQKPVWVDMWAKMELRDALKKLKEELNDEKVWLVGAFPTDEKHADTDLFSATEDYKHPLIAELATKVAWKMIQRCQNVSVLAVQTRFIKLTVVKFLYHFFNVLLLRCKTPESPSINPGEDKLVRLSISINAARYIESKLQEWSSDVNFVEMATTENNSSTNQLDSYGDNANFFVDELKMLGNLETNWLMEIIGDLISQFEILSRSYFRNNESISQMSSESTNMNFAVSCNIIDALDFLRSKVQVLKKLLNPIDFLDLWRSVADGIDHFIFSNILKSSNQFYDDTVNQFSSDVQALLLVFQPYCTRPEAFFPCLRDSLKLLKMEKKEATRTLAELSNRNITKDTLDSKKAQCLRPDQVKEILRMRKFWV